MSTVQPSAQGELLDAGSAWQQAEEELLRAGSHLPLYHRLAWAEQQPPKRNRLLIVRDADGRALAGVGLQRTGSRTMPGHHYLRVIQMGEGLPQAGWEPAIAALAGLARGDARLLGLSIGLFLRERRDVMAELLHKHGFRKSDTPQSYQYTLTLDLRPDEGALLQGMHKDVAKKIEKAESANVRMEPLVDHAFAHRLNDLQGEAMRRTHGTFGKTEWPRILDLSRLHPELSRVVGVFAPDQAPAPESLVGFAWGCMHGDHAEYKGAGTTRLPDKRITLSVPLVWDLIRWAKRNGASWFDMGGVTVDDPATDPFAGITQFKRSFSRTVEEVGEEWILEPHPARTHLATLLQRGGRSTANLLEQWKNRRKKSPSEQ